MDVFVNRTFRAISLSGKHKSSICLTAKLSKACTNYKLFQTLLYKL